MAKVTEMIQVQKDNEAMMLRQALKEVSNDYDNLKWRMEERLNGLDAMMRRDEFGWTPLGNFSEVTGPTLLQLHRRSKQLQEALALEPTVKQGSQLLGTYIWSDPIRYDNVPGLENGSTVGRGRTNIAKFIKDPLNQLRVFNSEARQIRERALYTDGCYLLEGENSSKRLRPIPLSRVSDVYCNPDWPDEIWAYRLAWQAIEPNGTLGPQRVEWIFTDLHKDKQVATINREGINEPVNREKTLIDGWVNQQVGWRYGFPHAGAILEWVRCYNEFMRAGMDMNSAMASIWANAKTVSAAGAQSVAAKLADMMSSGNTAAGNTEFTPLATAGRAYDFSAGTAILARAAAGLGLSVVALSSSPGDAGASYGSAATLDLPSRLNIENLRNWDCAYDERILRWMGAPEAVASFPALVDGGEMLRLKQAAQLDWNSGLYGDQEAKRKFEAAEGNRGEIGPIPDGVMIPNNEKSLARRDIDPNTSGSGSTPGTGAPGQGQSTGTGDIEQDRSTRDDTIS